MRLSGKELQRRWKERQKAKHKRQVTVMLSKRAYDGLNKIKEASNNTFSSIMNDAVLAFSSNVPKFSSHPDTRPEAIEHDFIDLRSQIDNEENRPDDPEVTLTKEEKFHFLLKHSRDAIWWADIATRQYEYISPAAKIVFGYAPDELKAIGGIGSFRLIHPDDQEEVRNKLFSLSSVKKGEKDAIYYEHRAKHPKLGYRWIGTSCAVVFNKKNEPVALVGNTRDIHRRKLTELALKELRDELEEKVSERTAKLEEANTALTLMLKKEQELKTELEDKILSNLKELVLPYMEKLKRSRLDSRERKYLDMMELNLGKIVSPFLRKLSSRFLSLTPSEIQVADLIRHGKSTKEIAELLNLSVRTIEGHRANVRKKIGIKNKKVSLRSHLLSLE